MDPVQTRPLFRAALDAADGAVTGLAIGWLTRRNYRVFGPFNEEWFKKARRVDPT